jgi:two-component system, OmpR family, sensor histidine kinase KdpD
METAQKMGGLVISLKHENVANALIAFAREYGITHIVLGRPGRRHLLQRMQATLYERILEELPEVDLVVV